MTQACIQFNNVTKQYGSQRVLKGIDLELHEGEFVGLVGINGAGKTTLIKCLLDLAGVSTGDITIFGQRVETPQSRAQLAFLPEKFIPPYYLTARDFIEYMQQLYGTARTANDVEEMLRALDFPLDSLLKPVRQLSKGMSQKLGLAACFLSDRPLYILDEPMSGLDPRARAYLKRYLLGLKDGRKSMFVSTHLLNDVEVLCDRVAILHQGLLRFVGTPAECCEYYHAPDFESAYLVCVEGDDNRQD